MTPIPVTYAARRRAGRSLLCGQAGEGPTAMELVSTDLLYAALALYGAGTSIALASLLFPRQTGGQRAAFIVMIAGFVAHTIFIGTICMRTGHPPLVNLAEIAAFIAWTILLIDLAIY